MNGLITDDAVDKGMAEAEVVIKILRMLKKMPPGKRRSTLEWAMSMVEAEPSNRESRIV